MAGNRKGGAEGKRLVLVGPHGALLEAGGSAAVAALEDLVRQQWRRELVAREREAAELIDRTLPPRLRWARRRPRALRLLRRVGLWSPPNLIVRCGPGPRALGPEDRWGG